MSLLTDKIKVSINGQKRTTVRTVGISSLAQTGKLSRLVDVDATDPDNNETLVFDASEQRYVIKTLPVVDGGSY